MKKQFEIWHSTNTDDPMVFLGKGEVNIDRLHETHEFIRMVSADDCQDAFIQMQGDLWDSAGENQDMIRILKTHTSMSVGDIMIDSETQIVFRVAMMGFDSLGIRQTPEKMGFRHSRCTRCGEFLENDEVIDCGPIKSRFPFTRLNLCQDCFGSSDMAPMIFRLDYLLDEIQAQE